MPTHKSVDVIIMLVAFSVASNPPVSPPVNSWLPHYHPLHMTLRHGITVYVCGLPDQGRRAETTAPLHPLHQSEQSTHYNTAVA